MIVPIWLVAKCKHDSLRQKVLDAIDAAIVITLFMLIVSSVFAVLFTGG